MPIKRLTVAANGSGAVTLMAGFDLTLNRNVTSGSGVSSIDQIVAAAAVLTAGRNIGSGVIDNTLTNTNNASDLNLNVASLTAIAGQDFNLCPTSGCTPPPPLATPCCGTAERSAWSVPTARRATSASTLAG